MNNVTVSVAIIMGVGWICGWGCLCAFIADARGRNDILWYGLGALFGFLPLFVLVRLPVLPPRSASTATRSAQMAAMRG
jgi:hypothetical protein